MIISTMGDRSNEDTEAALAWLQAVCQHGKSRPRDNLFSYFRGTSRQDDLTLPIVALLNACCKAVFPDGAGGCSSVDRHKAASYLYYIVAEDVLACLFPREPPSSGTAAALQRFKGLVRGAGPPPGCTALLACEEWHLPLVECALQLVQLATSTAPQDSIAAGMRHVTGLLQRGNRGVLLWQAAGAFLDSFGPGAPLQLPKGLRASLMHMRALLLDDAVLQTGSVFFQLLVSPPGPASGDGPAELLAGTGLAHQVVAAYGRQVVEAAHLTGWRVLQQHAGAKGSAGGAPALPPDFHEQCAWLLDCVVLRHLDVCFGMHASVVVGCSVYLAAKALAPGLLTFAGLAQAMAEALPADRLGSWDDVELSLTPPVRADIRAFYNQRFLPALRPHVHGYLAAYARRAAAEAAVKAAVKAAPAALRVISTNTAAAPDHAAGRRVPLAPKPSTADSRGSSSNSSRMGQRLQQQRLPAEDKENQAFGGGAGGAGRAVHAVQMGAGAQLRHCR